MTIPKAATLCSAVIVSAYVLNGHGVINESVDTSVYVAQEVTSDFIGTDRGHLEFCPDNGYCSVSQSSATDHNGSTIPLPMCWCNNTPTPHQTGR